MVFWNLTLANRAIFGGWGGCHCEPSFPLEYGNAYDDVATPFSAPDGPWEGRGKSPTALRTTHQEEVCYPTGGRRGAFCRGKGEDLGALGSEKDPWEYGVSLGLGCFGKITYHALQTSVCPLVKWQDRVVKGEAGS